MSAHESAEGPPRESDAGRLSIPFVIASSLLAGLGLLSLLYWVITFQWIWFLGIVPMTLGALMMFSPRAGPNSSG